MENRLKELQAGVAMDRTSCSRFAANQLRLLLSVATYVLFQGLQLAARATAIPGKRCPPVPPQAITNRSGAGESGGRVITRSLEQEPTVPSRRGFATTETDCLDDGNIPSQRARCTAGVRRGRSG